MERTARAASIHLCKKLIMNKFAIYLLSGLVAIVAFVAGVTPLVVGAVAVMGVTYIVSLNKKK